MAGDVGALGGYDAVVLGSAVYMKRWRGDAKHFLRDHAEELSRIPFWVFSSGPVGDPAEAPGSRAGSSRRGSSIAPSSSACANTSSSEAGSPPSRAGRSSGRWPRTRPQEYRDMRDWEQIRSWAPGIAVWAEPVA